MMARLDDAINRAQKEREDADESTGSDGEGGSGKSKLKEPQTVLSAMVQESDSEDSDAGSSVDLDLKEEGDMTGPIVTRRARDELAAFVRVDCVESSVDAAPNHRSLDRSLDYDSQLCLGGHGGYGGGDGTVPPPPPPPQRQDVSARNVVGNVVCNESEGEGTDGSFESYTDVFEGEAQDEMLAFMAPRRIPGSLDSSDDRRRRFQR